MALSNITFCLAYPQECCNHEWLITKFLNRISSPQYISTLQDYEMYFDEDSEIEIGLRIKFLNNNPNRDSELKATNNSLTIDTLLNNQTLRGLIDYKNKTTNPWIILKSYPKGTATKIYEVGIKGSSDYLIFQLDNWPQKKQCGICDILDSNGKSIFWN